MKYCTNCGTELQDSAKFCHSCGTETVNTPQAKTAESAISESAGAISNQPDLTNVNKKITLHNNQGSSVKVSLSIAGFFLLILVVAFLDFDFLPVHPALAFISLFLFISTLIIGFMFRGREKKLQTLIDGENLLAHWVLNPQQKENYVNYLFDQQAGMNKIILLVISVIATVVFGVFILIIDEGKLAMFGVLVGLILFLALFAFGMPYYYKGSNRRNDGQILIGGKYAYVNGYFHNWDYLLSGLSKVKTIKDPFYGIMLVYYYTDRTMQHSEELYIPANEDVDIDGLVVKLKELNSH